MPKLYDLEPSGNCYKVRLMSAVLGVPLDIVPVDFMAGAHKKSPLIDMNPFGEIPIFVDGDVVLRDSAAVVRNTLRGHGVLGRLGGEEFAAVLPHTELPMAADIAEHVRAAVADYVFAVGLQGGVPVQHRQTISIGVAAIGPDTLEPADLLAAADRQLYASKNGGRNRVSVDRR